MWTMNAATASPCDTHTTLASGKRCSIRPETRKKKGGREKEFLRSCYSIRDHAQTNARAHTRKRTRTCTRTMQKTHTHAPVVMQKTTAGYTGNTKEEVGRWW